MFKAALTLAALLVVTSSPVLAGGINISVARVAITPHVTVAATPVRTASPSFFKNCVTGVHYKKVTIH
jgi:hypothetical protein